MQSKVSVRGQTVVPREIRRAMGILPNSLLRWEVENGVILVYPVPADPVRASLGVLRGNGTFEEFLRERTGERVKESEREE